MRYLLLLSAALACLLGGRASASSQGTVATFLKDPVFAGRGTVVRFDETTGAPVPLTPALRGIVLLPLDFSGRTPITETDPSAARLCDDIPGAARIALPNGLGSLYHYERPGLDGSTFGFFFLDTQGQPSTLAEMFVSRDQGSRDPFHRRIALAPDGKSFLVATKRHGGADLLEVEIETGVVINRTLHMQPRQFLARGLTLGERWGVAATTTGMLRFHRGPRQLAREVDFPLPAPNAFSGDVVLSSNTDWALVTAGEPAHTYAFNATSPAVQVSEQAARMSHAGHLPHFNNGPYMAISDDGQLAAWRQEMIDPVGQPSTELFLARVPAALPTPAEQLSSDARYLDTLDEVGQIFFLDPTTLAYTVGEREPGVDTLGFAGADIFTAKMPAGPGAPQILNLSQTNGQLGPPFTIPPEMKPKKLAWLPSEQRFLIFDDGDAEAVVTIDATLGGLQVIMDQVKDIGLFKRTPQGFLFDARRTNAVGGAWDLMRHTGSLTSAPILVESSANDNLNGREVARRDGQVAFVGSPGGTDRLSRVHVTSGVMESMTGAGPFGPVIGHSPDGSLAFSKTLAGGSTQFGLWKPGGAVLMLASPVGTGFILPAL